MRRIARLAERRPGDHVVEIGAGLGSLTLALAETGATVTAIEVDHGVAGVLARGRRRPAERHRGRGRRDATRLGGTARRRADRWVLVANLPYNVATPLVCDLLDDVPAVERMLVMVQREVAERLCAAAGAEAYGAVSVKVAYWATARIVGHGAGERVPAAAEGRVGAGRDPPPPEPRGRRGSPSRCSRWCGPRSGSGARCCAARSPTSSLPRCSTPPGIDPQRRPEELDVDEWGALTRAWLARR